MLLVHEIVFVGNKNNRIVDVENKISNESLNVSDLQKGVYFVKVVTEKGIATKKILFN